LDKPVLAERDKSGNLPGIKFHYPAGKTDGLPQALIEPFLTWYTHLICTLDPIDT